MILLILLVIVLAAMVFLILKHQETLKTAQTLERQLTDLQEQLNPEAAQEQTRQQLMQLEVQLRQQEQAVRHPSRALRPVRCEFPGWRYPWADDGSATARCPADAARPPAVHRQ